MHYLNLRMPSAAKTPIKFINMIKSASTIELIWIDFTGYLYQNHNIWLKRSMLISPLGSVKK